MAQYPKIESIGSMGSIIVAILEVQVWPVGYRPLPGATSPGATPVRADDATWTSKMAKIMDPILPILSVFWDMGPLFWALLEVQVA